VLQFIIYLRLYQVVRVSMVVHTAAYTGRQCGWRSEVSSLAAVECRRGLTGKLWLQRLLRLSIRLKAATYTPRRPSPGIAQVFHGW
jgi:hypothetical protein